MNAMKTIALSNIDVVNGYVIGEFTRRIALVSPNGNVQKETDIPYEDDPVEWGEKVFADIMNQKCGDGKPLSYHKHVANVIYGSGQWTIRVYE